MNPIGAESHVDPPMKTGKPANGPVSADESSSEPAHNTFSLHEHKYQCYSLGEPSVCELAAVMPAGPNPFNRPEE